jgi:RNA recognition motif-containing protein
MGSKVYVGNLPFSVDEQQLTGRPRGFAFVNMAIQEEAQAAINSLNGTEVGGRALTINMAREQQPRGGGFGRRDRY